MILAAFTVILFAACGGSKNKSGRETAELTGAGATFPLPFYTQAFNDYQRETGDEIAYGGIGSGGGVRNLRDGIVDFCGSDAFISDEEAKGMKPVVHIPTCLGAVVLAYNLPGVNELKLSGDVIADIYAGKINKWNDRRIAAQNAGVKLPNNNIVVVYRSDGSGTTFNFTDYLSKVSQSWNKAFGKGKTVDFPVGIAAKGNPGVAGIIANTKYSIGYIGSEVAFAQKIPFASVQNSQGVYVKPSEESISAAAGDIPLDTRCSITNASGKDAYPISCFTWLIVYKEQNYSGRKAMQAVATVKLMEYMLSDKAQQITRKLHYCPLPQQAVNISRQNLHTVTYDGKAILK